MSRTVPLRAPWPTAGLHGGTPPAHRWASAARVSEVGAHRSPSDLVFPQPARCGRRTRPFSGRAFREHRTNVCVLPILFIFRLLLSSFLLHPERKVSRQAGDRFALYCARRKRASTVTPQGEQPDCSSLRALRDHRFIVGPQRARRMVRLLPFISF